MRQIMQRWTRANSCIFCQFRASLKRHGSVSRDRTYQTQTTRDANTQSRIQRPRDAKLRSLRNNRDAFPSSKDTIPISRVSGRRDAFISAEEEKERAFKKRTEILRSLRKVRAFYRDSTMGRSSSISQLKGLDPDGTLWPEFESIITQALESKNQFAAGAGLVKNLMDIKSDERRSDTEREVRFAFLDFVLDHQKSLNINPKSMDMRYPTEWYPAARAMQRVIHLHVGPTNSGKTYNALKRLEESGNGFYAGPLRLLAHEVYSRFNNRGIKCDLITGDDVRVGEPGEIKLYASTVEMVDSCRVSDVGVVDEIQMLGDEERGWAWTRALLSAQVKELHLCGETRAVPLVREIVASMGDTLHIHQYERLNPLKVMSRSIKGNLQNLRKGDCVVAFSIMNIHALKRQIEVESGKRCAIIYGGLPPETRAQQAALFNDPDNDYDFLAASDAIGMGLNLSIKRIVFETTRKFNGTFHERLSIPQIKQIAGRAGRYRTAQDDKSNAPKTSAKPVEKSTSIGLVTCLDEADLPILQHALSTDGLPLKAAGILPPGEFYENLASHLPEDTPFEYILRRMNVSVSTNDRFRLCDIRDQVDIARAIEEVKGLPIEVRLTFCAAPASFRSSNLQNSMRQVMVALAQAISLGRPVTVADIQEIPLEVLDEPMTADRLYLASLENLHKSLILYLWLSYRFPRNLRDQDMAVRAKQLCEEKINTTLLKVSANPKLRDKLLEVRKSSELLRDQAKVKGWVTDMPMTMNPDKTLEEIESDRVLAEKAELQQGELGPEHKVEVEGELDLDMDEELKGEMLQVDNQQNEEVIGGGENKDEEPQRATGSG